MGVLLKMTHSKSNSDNANITTDDVKPTIFHDFLGSGCTSGSSPAAVKGAAGEVRPPSEASPSASASAGASSGGGCGPISTTSDLGSERQVGNHFEGVPFYGPRSDFSGSEIGNRFTASKRSNSDSAFMASSRDGFPQMRSDSLESSHLMKMLRSAGGERPQRPHDGENFFGMHPVRPTSASLILQPATSSRTDAIASKWERAIPLSVGPMVQYPPRSVQVVPFGYQAPSNRFKDANAVPTVISQAAADEGSRTGIKRSGILSPVNAGGGIADRSLPSGGKLKSGTCVSGPESSTDPSRQGLTSASRQMTIFYGGQAHVFDDVHPNKADVIMALAGSNGGSWSTTYSPKSAVRPSAGENYLPSGEKDTGMAGNSVLPREFRGRLSVAGNSSHGFGSGNGISVLPGVHQGSIIMEDARGPIGAAEPSTEEKREV